MNAHHEFSRKFAEENLAAGARELIEWSETAILPQGVIRGLADYWEEQAGHSALRLAEDYFKMAALRKVAA